MSSKCLSAPGLLCLLNKLADFWKRRGISEQLCDLLCLTAGWVFPSQYVVLLYVADWYYCTIASMCLVAHKWPYQCHLPVPDELYSDLSYLLLADDTVTGLILFCL